MTAPFLVGVAELLRHPGTQREIDVGAELEGLEISSAVVPPSAEVRGQLTLESLSDHGLTVTGVLTAPWRGQCRRCLEEVDGIVEVHVKEVFDTAPVEGETYPLTGDHLDLEPMVRDAVLLALPLAPLCEETCAGPEPEGHPLGAEAGHEPDPRWAKLGDLEFE